MILESIADNYNHHTVTRGQVILKSVMYRRRRRRGL